ncbi:MAG: HAD family hydrolase [Kiloniellales bacterium]|nr:HAD family hydrolase [Kiloniellales bacterium]
MTWLGEAADQTFIAELVSRYRSHDPEIRLYPGVKDLLLSLRESYRFAIVTDGNAEMQRRKIAALGLSSFVDKVHYAWDLSAPKPDPASFLKAIDKLGVSPANTLVIGDDPHRDIVPARQIGCIAVRVRQGRFAFEENDEKCPPHLELQRTVDISKHLGLGRPQVKGCA